MSEKWELEVYCRRGGVTRDGGVHRTFDHEPSAAEVSAELAWLRRTGGYDEIGHKVRHVEARP